MHRLSSKRIVGYFGLIVLVLSALSPRSASAQSTRRLRPSYVDRPLTLQKGVLRIDAGPADFALLSQNRGFNLNKPAFGLASVGTPQVDPGDLGGFGGDFGSSGAISDPGSDVGVFFGTGAAYGITDEIEAGALLVPLSLAPGGVHYGDIVLYGRYLLMNDKDMAIALHSAMNLPIQTNFGVSEGVALLLKLSDRARLDSGIVANLTFAKPDVVFGIEAPVALTFQATDTIFVGARTGVSWRDVSSSHALAIPLGVHAGVNVADGMIDLMTWFVFPALISPDGVTGDLWNLGAGATVRFDTQS